MDWLWAVTVGLEEIISKSRQLPCGACSGECFLVRNGKILACPHQNMSTHPGVLGRHRIVGKLGIGAFCTVFLVQDARSQQLFACKVIPRQLRIILENDFQASTGGQLGNFSLTHLPSFSIFLQERLQEMPLFRLLFWRERLDMLRRVLGDVSRGLIRLHGKGLVHADIKTSNLMYRPGFSRSQFLLVDYGNAISLQELSRNPTTDVCTPLNRAPELLELHPELTLNGAIDVWALGVSVIEICREQHPFLEVPITKLLMYIHDTLGQNRAQVRLQLMCWTDNNDSHFIDLLEGMLRLNPKDRLTPEQILEHPFLTDHH